MAFLAPGPRPGIWQAMYYCTTKRKQVKVPAKIVREWDGMNRVDADRALADWVVANGIEVIRKRSRSLLPTDELSGLINSFIEAKTAAATAESEAVQAVRSNLETYVVEYFVEVKLTKKVKDWWPFTDGFATWLRSTYTKQNIDTARKICLNLQAFGVYLARKQVIIQPWLIELPKRRKNERSVTPLKKALTPKEVLAAAKRLEKKDKKWALAVLLMYFASLRPEEALGLEKSDFITGDKAVKDSLTHKRFAKHKIGSKLAISISKSRSRKGQREVLKTARSYGVVTVWSLAGAKAIASIVKEFPEGLIFGDSKRYALDEEWLKIVKPVIYVQQIDLRRASCLHLGRVIGVDPFLLQDHTRHSSLKTMLLYTRRPVEEKEAPKDQDWSDVG